MAKALVFVCCCVLMAVVHEPVLMTPAMASRGLVDESFGGQKNYYPTSPTDPHHSPTPSPKTPCSPTPSHGGGPSTTLPTTPSSQHGGGTYYPPTPPISTTPPTVTPTPLVPVAPIISPPTPFIPLVPTPPSTTPTPFDPNIPPFFTGTCNFWRTHPATIWALFGFWCPVGTLFGASAASPFGHDLSVPEALANTRTDGIGELYREGTASLLNSMVNHKFPFTTQQVKGAFGAALKSGDRSAAAQAKLFKKANEGHLKH